jgi:hypothetical protein
MQDLDQMKKDAMANPMVTAVLGNLAKLGYMCVLARSDDGVWVIDYARPGDLDKPAIRIEGQKIIMPKGSSLDLLELILGS